MLIEVLVALVIDLVVSHNSDQIKALPGLVEEPQFKQYSGYLNGGQDIHIFYWFVESQVNPSTDPVLLWLNGGPGESSLWGLFVENGPFRVASDGKTLTSDPNSWNTLANILYLESPVGVGFSHFSGNGTFSNTDQFTAKMNLKAIQNFFEKFPQFKANRFYIAGESYGGVYVPTLALEVLNNDPGINLRGVAIGNGYLDSEMLKQSRLDFAYYHGFVDHQALNNWTKTNCNCLSGTWNCPMNNTSQLVPVYYEIVKIGMTPYNILDNICSNIKYNYTDSTTSVDSSKYFAHCLPDALKIYMNRPETRKVLGLHDTKSEWQTSRSIVYEEINSQKSMKDHIKEIVAMNKLDQFIVYYGDMDMVCDFIGGQTFVEDLGLELKEKRKMWKIDGRVVGYVKQFVGLTFVIVNNAGHSVPMDRPDAGLAILKELIGISRIT